MSDDNHELKGVIPEKGTSGIYLAAIVLVHVAAKMNLANHQTLATRYAIGLGWVTAETGEEKEVSEGCFLVREIGVTYHVLLTEEGKVVVAGVKKVCSP